MTEKIEYINLVESCEVGKPLFKIKIGCLEIIHDKPNVLIEFNEEEFIEIYDNGDIYAPWGELITKPKDRAIWYRKAFDIIKAFGPEVLME